MQSESYKALLHAQLMHRLLSLLFLSSQEVTAQMLYKYLELEGNRPCF
jgi:hypothetical protein